MALSYQGWRVAEADVDADVVARAEQASATLVVVDTASTTVDDLDLVRRLRQRRPSVLVVVLTQAHAASARVQMLDAGADDCVSTPVLLDELVVRLTSLLRRTTVRTTSSGVHIVGDLRVEEGGHEVTRGGDYLYLTPSEFEVLVFLMRHQRRVVPNAELLRRIGRHEAAAYPPEAKVAHAAVRKTMFCLRRKVDAGRPPMIHTLRGQGYILKPA